MSLFVEGMKCRLCGQPMTSNQSILGFQPFVANERDRLHLFHDGVFHESCVEKHPLGLEARRWNKKAIESGSPEMRRSFVTNKPITDLSDYLPVGFLTSDEKNPLYEFNFAHFSKSELRTWNRLDELTETLRREQESGNVAGRGIDWIISELRQIQENCSA